MNEAVRQLGDERRGSLLLPSQTHLDVKGVVGVHCTARKLCAVDRVAASSRHAVTIFADQLFTNTPKRSSALEKFSPAAPQKTKVAL